MENMDLYMLNPCSTKIWWVTADKEKNRLQQLHGDNEEMHFTLYSPICVNDSWQSTISMLRCPAVWDAKLIYFKQYFVNYFIIV